MHDDYRQASEAQALDLDRESLYTMYADSEVNAGELEQPLSASEGPQR